MDRALFLDRDGVLNVDHGYIKSPAQFDVIAGVFDALRQVLTMGYRLIVVTNQSGIARGYFTAAHYAAVESHMIAQFAAEGIPFTGIYHCPHHPSATQSEFGASCDCRKPNPGMILRACAEHGLDASRSVLVGDKISDIEAGRAAAVGRCFLIRSSYAGAADGYGSLAEVIASPEFRKNERKTWDRMR